MKEWQIRFTPRSAKEIRKLPPEPKALIRQAVDELRMDPYAGADLTGEMEAFRTIKPKRYRIIYRINEEQRFVEVLLVGRRSDIYENFRKLLLILRK